MDILNALVKHYDAMAAAGNATPFGWTHKFAQYAVELNDDGEIDRIFALGDLSDKKNKGEEFEMPGHGLASCRFRMCSVMMRNIFSAKSVKRAILFDTL